MKIEFEDGSVKYLYNGETYLFNETGKYIISLTDTARNKTSFKTVFLSLEKSFFKSNIKYDEDEQPIALEVNFECLNKINKLSSILIKHYNEQKGEWITLTHDNKKNENKNYTAKIIYISDECFHYNK